MRGIGGTTLLQRGKHTDEPVLSASLGRDALEPLANVLHPLYKVRRYKSEATALAP
jgi:hypothetical protein